MMDVRAVLFDVFGTVVDWRGSLIRDLSAFGGAHGLSADWAGLADRWRGAYQPQMDRVRHKAVAWTSLDGLHREVLDRLLPEFGLERLGEPDRLHLNRAWHRLAPWADSVGGLGRIKAARLIAPLSNGNVSLLVDMARHAGLPWDMVFGADLFRHYKPDPQTYLGACALLDLPPARVMMCAAHNGDLHAARALGMRTAFIARPLEYGPGQTTDLVPEEPWDLVADDLESLASLLERESA